MRALLAVSLCVCLGLTAPAALVAQEQEEEGPGTRVVAVTSFQVPFADRETLLPWMAEYFLPGIQLNPHVVGFRMLFHNWGSDASRIVLVQEFEDISLIEADCGQPCEDYFEAHPEPEKGEEGYEEFQKGQELFTKYYSHHSDEIYASPMVFAKVEGEMVGTVGGPPEQEEEDGEGGGS